MSRALRVVVFSPSIISDVGNPQATTVRAMCQAFAEVGHDVTHLEARGNEHLDRMLRMRGYAPMRAFNGIYPLIRYRQYTIPRGMERSIWFGREIATADVIVGYPGIPPEVQDEITAFDIPRRIRFSPASTDETASLLPQWFNPAVLPQSETSSRSGAIAVAYDNNFDPGDVDNHLTLGTLEDPEWAPQSEIQMPEIYAFTSIVRMDAAITNPLERARTLLPVAHGTQVELIAPNGQVAQTIISLSAPNNARIRTTNLTMQINQLLTERSASK